MTSGYKFVGVKPLADDVALSDGIAYVSEFTLFSIAGGIIVIEYVRGEKKNAEKSAKAAEKEEMMRRNIEERFTAIESKLDKLAGALETREGFTTESTAIELVPVVEGVDKIEKRRYDPPAAPIA